MKDLKLNLSVIGLTKLKSVFIETPDNTVVHSNTHLVISVAHEFMNLGYIMSGELYNKLCTLQDNEIVGIAKRTLKGLRVMKGAHVEHNPMYPNFPQQVIDMSLAESLINQLIHYWSAGTLLPSYEKERRSYGLEKGVKYQMIGVCSREDIFGVFTRLLSSNDSIKSTDKEIIEYFIENYNPSELPYPASIPYKENVCIVGGMFITAGKDINGLVKNATDVLRIATYLSGGDISLVTNTKFKSFPRSIRRVFANALENVIKEEDIKRHQNKWIKLFHSLHIGEYSKKVADIARKAREGKALYSVAGDIVANLNKGQIKDVVKLLQHRAGDYARMLDELLRKNPESSDMIVHYFSGVADKVSTRVLLQVYSHFMNRKSFIKRKRVIFPKGSVQSALILPDYTTEINDYVIENIIDVVDETLLERFGKLEDMNKVFIDERLVNCPLPTQLRSASESVSTVARGTRMPIGDDSTLRFFVYWKGEDIDLSATLHDEKFEQIGYCSYTMQKNSEYKAYHSGDMTHAPYGATEFIDIEIEGALKSGARYIIMNLYVYAGPNFNKHEVCFAGWMTRSEPKSNEIFEPKTVVNKFDIVSASRNAIPVVFDLQTREAIWCDLTTPGKQHWGGNNVESNKASTEQVLDAIVHVNKFNLYDLFLLHANARNAEFVDTSEDADYVFGLYDGINPTNIDIINSEFIV